MGLKPLKITFTLDGSGIIYDPREPITLDGLLAWALAPFHCSGEAPSRNEKPDDIPLPLGRWEIGRQWGWHASALFPDDEGEAHESLQYWRKRFRQSRAEIMKGTVNIASGIYRDYNMPMPVNPISRMTAWALGDRKRIDHILRKQIKYLGKKRSYGKGRVNEISVEWCDEDFSLAKDGCAMRWLPREDGLRIVRPRPPYWNIVGAIPCCEIGEEYNGKPVSKT